MDVVYIDDQIIDIDPDTKIAWTIQRVDIGDISKNYSSFSNTIKAADTERNNRIFKNAKLDKGADTFQYAFHDCKVVQNGIETITGKAQITGYSGNYSIVIYDTFVSLISFIEGKTILDIDFGISAWNATDIDSARLSTSGFIAAVMSWGRTSIYEANYFLPCYYYHTLIDKILTTTGLTLSGDILSSTDFTDLVCTPINKFLYPESGKANDAKITETTNSLNFFADGLEIESMSDIIEYGASNTVDVGGYYRIKSTKLFYADLVFTYTIASWTTDGVAQIRIRIKKIDADLLVSTIETSAILTGNVSGTLTASSALINPGDVLFVDLTYTQISGTYLTLDLNSSFTLTALRTVVRTNVIWNLLANKKSLKDILKDFFVRFGLVYKIVDNTIVFKTLESICSDTSNAVDWTSKRIITKSGIEFKTNYAQSNYFLHQDDAKDKFLGSGTLAIANTTLKAASDFFTSVFANVKRWTGSGYEVMSSPAYDSTSTGIDDIKNEPPFMIGTLKARTSEASISFNGVARTDYKLAYHANITQPKDTSFRYFLSKYYPSLTLALQKNKICKYQYNLNETDIANYDPHKMIFDNGSYYLINKISNFRSGKITTVELFKIH